MRPSRIHLFAGLGIAVTLALFVKVLDVFDAHIEVTYPLTQWRMDLDDALIGVGTVLIGVAAIWTVYLKQRATERRVEALGAAFNGGMAAWVREHLQESEVLQTIMHRMDRFEDERDDCINERRDLHERLIDCLEGGSDDDRSDTA